MWNNNFQIACAASSNWWYHESRLVTIFQPVTEEKPVYTETRRKCFPAVEECAQEQEGSSVSSQSEQLQFSTEAQPGCHQSLQSLEAEQQWN